MRVRQWIVGVQLGHSAASANILRELGASWIQLPKWERELRCVLDPRSFVSALMPPPWVTDASSSVNPPSVAEDPRQLSHPGTFLVEPDPRDPAPVREEDPSVLFARKGCLNAPLECPADVVKLTLTFVERRLPLLRPVELYLLEDEESLTALTSMRITAGLRGVLAELHEAGIDVPRVCGTLIQGADLFRALAGFYRSLIDQRKSVRKETNRLLNRLYRARRVLTTKRYILRPQTLTDIDQLIAAYKQVRAPDAAAVRRYRERIGIGGRQKTLFWTALIHWTTAELMKAGYKKEIDACRITARLLNEARPRLVRRWTPGAVKKRRYDALYNKALSF